MTYNAANPISDAAIYQLARALGFDDEAARVPIAVAITEAGRSGAIGDAGQSFGPFQFYTGGMLPAFAQYLGVSVPEAGQIAINDQAVAITWALSTYLGAAIRQGQMLGYRGAELATYAQRYGQRSVSPERTGANYLTIANVDYREGSVLSPDGRGGIAGGALLILFGVIVLALLKG